MLNLIGIAVITLFINTYGVVYFGLNEFPDWARPTPVVTTAASALNTTSVIPPVATVAGMA